MRAGAAVASVLFESSERAPLDVGFDYGRRRLLDGLPGGELDRALTAVGRLADDEAQRRDAPAPRDVALLARLVFRARRPNA